MFLFLHHVAKSAISPKVTGGTFFLGCKVVSNAIDVNSTLLLHSYENLTLLTMPLNMLNAKTLSACKALQHAQREDS